MANKGQKKSWGALDKTSTNGADVDEPAPKMSKYFGGGGAPVKLADIDVAKFHLSDKKNPGAMGDAYTEMFYDDKRVIFCSGDLGEYAYSPFPCGPVKKDGVELSPKHSIALEISQEAYDKLREFEDKMVKTHMPNRNHLMSHTFKKAAPGKPPPSISEEQFERDFHSPLMPADPEKGYRPKIKIGVQHPELKRDGTPKPMPTIYTTKLMGPNQWTQPKVAGIEALTAGAAVSGAIFSVVRGNYFGGTGWGWRVALQSCHVFPNKNNSQGHQLDSSHMTVVPDPDDDEPKFPPPTPITLPDALPNALPGYDDGSGNAPKSGDLSD